MIVDAPTVAEIREKAVSESWVVHVSKGNVDNAAIRIQRNNVQRYLGVTPGEPSKGGKWQQQGWPRLQTWYAEKKRGWTESVQLALTAPVLALPLKLRHAKRRGFHVGVCAVGV